jgi:glucose-6-phosphate dehydrogenase assembly protein OpcA
MTQPQAPERIDVATLERQLGDLWKQMASKSQEEGQQTAVTRACVHNLVVYAPGERSESELSRLLADLMVDQPGRVILMLSDQSIRRDTLSGWVNAQCHFTAGQRQQVCSELITVRAGRSELHNLSSLVIPLLVPDLPIFFWWREDLTTDWKLFEELLENADRVILDSARFTQPVPSLKRVVEILRAERGATSFSDLNWNRLTPWRQMITGFFDHTSCRGMLNCISSLDIQASTTSKASAEAILLVGWLASRLKWQPDSRANPLSFLNTEGKRVNVRIFTRAPGKEDFRGLATVTLRAEDPQFTLHLATDLETRYVRGLVEMQGMRPADRVARLGRWGEEGCLVSELEILGPDRIYEDLMELLDLIL